MAINRHGCKLFLVLKNSLLCTLTAADFSDVVEMPLGQKGEKCMQIRAKNKLRQSRFKYGSKVSGKGAKLSTSVSLHSRNKSVCLWMKSQGRRLHP